MTRQQFRSELWEKGYSDGLAGYDPLQDLPEYLDGWDAGYCDMEEFSALPLDYNREAIDPLGL